MFTLCHNGAFQCSQFTVSICTYVIYSHKGQLLLLKTIPKKENKTPPYMEL